VNATPAQLFWWVALPYLALAVFIVGHVWRWRYDQFGWTSRSTQLQERRLLKWGGPLFHYGTFAAIAGHVIGILIPERWTKAIGIPEDAYRWFSAGAGTLAVLVIGGVVVLASRRLLVARVRATTAPIDWVTLILLLVVILTGIALTIGVNLFGHGYDYRTTVAPWFRGLFSFSPDSNAIARAVHLPVARHRGLGDLGPVALQPPSARLELPAVVPVAALRRIPQPRPAAPARAGHRRPQMAQDRRPLLMDAIRDLHPGYSAFVMATGIISTGAFLAGAAMAVTGAARRGVGRARGAKRGPGDPAGPVPSQRGSRHPRARTDLRLLHDHGRARRARRPALVRGSPAGHGDPGWGGRRRVARAGLRRACQPAAHADT
jgi:nitrate reductase gamma subunit